MDTILHALLWIALIFVMMKYGCGSHLMGHGHKKLMQNKDVSAPKSHGSMRWTPPEKDVDPVCKKVIYTDRSKPSVHSGDVYFFCSRECREVFEAAPALYLSPELRLERHRMEIGD